MSRVLLADDHPLFRHALRAVVARAQAGFEISEADSLAGAKNILARENDVILILLDLKLSDCGNFAGLLCLRGEYPQIPVVVVSSSSDSHTISHALALGAAGFIPKSSSMSNIEAAVAEVLAGGISAPSIPFATQISATIKSIASLTPAELKVLMGLQRGLRNKEIAHEMGVTEKTVKAYTSMVYRKLGVNSRTQAIIAMQTVTAETELTSQ